MKGYCVELKDNGQDFTKLITDDAGVVVRSEPFQTSIWKGAYIPIESLIIGDLCMIHHPPNIVYGHLKHEVLSITEIELNNE